MNFVGHLKKSIEEIGVDKSNIVDLVNPIVDAKMGGKIGTTIYTLNDEDEEDKELINLMNELTIKYKGFVVLSGGSKKKSHRKTRKTRRKR
jgi:hypothetical protein